MKFHARVLRTVCTSDSLSCATDIFFNCTGFNRYKIAVTARKIPGNEKPKIFLHLKRKMSTLVSLMRITIVRQIMYTEKTEMKKEN